MRATLALFACVALACSPEIPEGHAVCQDATQCPTTWACRSDHRCWRTGDGSDSGPLADGGIDGALADAGHADAGRDGGSNPPDAGTDAPPCARQHMDGDGAFTACAFADAGDAPDCDDTNMHIHPGATEVCNGADDDCDGMTDDADPDLGCAWHYCDGNACDTPSDVAAGLQHTCALTSAGHVWCWGANDHSQLGVPSAGAGSTTPVHVLAHATDLAAGTNHTCIVDATGVQCWGLDNYGQIGNAVGGSDQTTPLLVPNTVGASSLTAGAFHTCATLPDPRGLSCWGRNNSGQLGDGTTTTRATPASVVSTGISRPAFAGGNHTCYQNGTGTVRCWGLNDHGQLGINTVANATTPGPTLMPTITDGHEIRPGESFTCVYRNDTATIHGYYCWGANESGQLGDGTLLDHHTAVAVATTMLDAGTAAAHYLAAGQSHACATDASRLLYCWGANDSGQLGTGLTTRQTTPVRNMLAGMISALDAGAQHTCAIVGSDLYCWGANALGQLGDGTMTANPVPSRVIVRSP